MENFLALCEGVKDYHRVSLTELYHRAFKTWMEDFKINEIPKNPRVKNLKEQGLDAEDGFFIWSYTGSSSSWLNSDKRNGEDYNSGCKREFADKLEKVLLKLPIFFGTVYRMEENDDDGRKINWFKNNVGLKIRIPYFLSTALEDYNNTQMIWIINTHKNGNSRDISKISNNLHEQEVLFIRDSEFIIMGVDESDPAKQVVYLDELPPSGNAQFELSSVYYHTD